LRDSSGPKNEPQYATSGVPADAADLTELGAYAATVGNRKVGTTSQRTALSGADVWEGLDYWDTTLNVLFRYRSGAWTQVYAGTNLIIPTTVAGGTVNAAGKVSFSSATNLSVDGVFSGAFDNYRIFIKTVGATGGDIIMKMRSGGVDNAASAYTEQRTWAANGSSGVSQQINATTGWLLTAGTGSYSAVVIDLVSPFIGEVTNGVATWNSVTATVSNGTTGLFHNTNASFTGFSLSVASGAISGTVVAYGYQSS
jgi:hypothetical protein